MGVHKSGVISNNFIVLITLIGIPLVFVPIGKTNDFFYLPKVLTLFILMASYLLLLLKNMKNVKLIIDQDAIYKSLVIYLDLLILSVFFAFDRVFAIFGSPGRLEGIITMVMYMLIFIAARFHTKVNEKFFAFIMGSAVIVALYGIIQFFGLEPFSRILLELSG